MNIDTTSKEAMQKSIHTLFNIDDKQLKDILIQAFNYCQKYSNHYVDGDLEREFFKEYIRNNIKQEIDEIRFFHLSRRLKDDDNTCYNLVHLLSQSLKINDFLKEHGLTFGIKNNEIMVYFRNQKIEIYDKYKNIQIDNFQNQIVGFAFKDNIVQNEYYSMLSEVPQFITNLAYVTRDFTIIDDYINNSEYYCYEYSLPLNMVLFDEEEELSSTEKQYYIIESVLERLYDYQYQRQSPNDIDNVLLRVVNQEIPQKYFITKTKF